jgi:hypothetical protein
MVLAAVILLTGPAQADDRSGRGSDHAERVLAGDVPGGRQASGQPRSGHPVGLERREEHVAKPSGRDQPVRAEQPKALPEVRDAAGHPLPLSDEACSENVARAASRGLRLPEGWEIHCVGLGLDWEGGSHWGVTCPYADCPEGGGPYVSISNPTYYVVAHELCHANFGTDELMADACAAEHGASLATSPYN